MAFVSEADVAVVGAGPAGSALALTLRTYAKLSVALFERSSFAQPRAGEALPPSAAPLLRYLGVWDEFLAEGHTEAHGTAAAWDGDALRETTYLFSGQGAGWLVDRARFDAFLAEHAASRGAQLALDTVVEDVAFDERERCWEVAYERGGERAACRARFVVDASGPSARVARKLGARFVEDDDLYAVLARYRTCEPREDGVLVEAVPDGWWYCASVPGGITVATLITGLEEMRRLDPMDPARWLRLVAATTHLRARTGGELPLSLDARYVPSRRCEPAYGPRWVAVGDAAIAFDPLSSLGIGYALASGANAARAIEADLRGDGSLLAQYGRSVAQAFGDYRARRAAYYAAETRWRERPFWALRSGALAVARTT